MNFPLNGELVPEGGGDPIPLIQEVMTLGRRETCDIRMPFPNISGLHAELSFRSGYWYIRDRNSTNGIKVNGVRVQEKLLHPGDKVTIGKRIYVISYNSPTTRDMLDETEEDIMSQSLLERAGLERPHEDRDPKRGKGKTKGKGFDAADFLLGDE
jgi:pSer/pThr/pTyr-binding forkhead associated (FHA) protein